MTSSAFTVDIGQMMPFGEFKEHMDCMIQEIKAAPLARFAERIICPARSSGNGAMWRWSKAPNRHRREEQPGDLPIAHDQGQRTAALRRAPGQADRHAPIDQPGRRQVEQRAGNAIADWGNVRTTAQSSRKTRKIAP